ncbi:MAG: hypothetical protein H6737_22650 [Alphaproteobacteria bacterium]|nr:hypothetical protein [Alphaproteobacteria bacterium]
MDDPFAILAEAIEVAQKRGAQADGWMMASSPTGVVAWLYREDEEGQWALFDEVDEKPTPLEAAHWVLEQAALL